MYRGHDATLEVNIVSKKTKKLRTKKVAIEKKVYRESVCIKLYNFFHIKLIFTKKLQYTF